MSENDYSWLLRTISNVSTNLNLLYDLHIKIPEVILLSNGEPKMWFYEEKGHIKTRNDNYLKLRLVKEYFVDPQAVNDPQLFDFDFMMYNNSKQNAPDPYRNKVLFNVNIEQPSKEIRVVKKITKEVADDLFANVTESMEFLKSWTKIYSHIPSKGASLFDVYLTKTTKNDPPKLKIVKRDFTLRNVEFSDYQNKLGKRASDNQQSILSDQKASSTKFQSIAASTNTAIEKAIKGVARFLEGKTKMPLGNLHLELIVDSSYFTWIVGCKEIHFFNREGNLEREIDKETIEFPKVPLKQFFTCPGTYCRFAGETTFHQEGDEAINLYVNEIVDEKSLLNFLKEKKAKKNNIFEIPFKSILLDIIERCKQIERFKGHDLPYNDKQILSYIESHPFDFRKYYSIGEVLQSSMFKGYRVSNLLRCTRVCQNCQFIYEKIDGYRVEKVLKPENRRFNIEEAKITLDKFFEKNPGMVNNSSERKKIFTDAFYEKIALFDKNLLEILGLEKQVETFEDFFDLTSPTMKKLIPPQSSRASEHMNSSSLMNATSVKFPKVAKETIRDPNNVFKIEKLRIADRAKAEVIGYKHYLGHTSYLPESGAGYALSKSSINLNKLQDKLNRFNRILDKRSSAMPSRDPTNNFIHPRLILEPINEDAKPSLQNKRLQQIQQDTSRSGSPMRNSFEVAVNKLDFYSEQAKEDLYEKENREKEKEKQQKNFLAKHNLLAKSITTGSIRSHFASVGGGLLADYKTPGKVEDLVNNFA